MRIALVLPNLPATTRALHYLFQLAAGLQPHVKRGHVSLWLPQHGPEDAQRMAQALPLFVGEVLCAPATHRQWQPPLLRPWLEAANTAARPDATLVYGSILGTQLAHILHCITGARLFTDVFALEAEEGRVLALRKACNSNLNWPLALGAPTVLSTAAGLASYTGPTHEVAPRVVAPGAMAPPLFGPSAALGPAAQNPLLEARTLLVGGRGLGSRAACDALRVLAAQMGGQAAFSRAAATNGWGGFDEIIGQSGVRVAPQLCITFGVSGASAFLAGVQDAKTLVAVNTDPDAPIFQHAEYGIVADAPQMVARLAELLPPAPHPTTSEVP